MLFIDSPAAIPHVVVDDVEGNPKDGTQRSVHHMIYLTLMRSDDIINPKTIKSFKSYLSR